MYIRTALAMLMAMVLGQGIRAAEQSPPNIVFFLIDDLGRTDVGFMGQKEIKTPNIDQLAKQGAILDAHYVQPVCSPTRSALMTGRYPIHTGVYTVVRPHAKWGLPLNERTLATQLQAAGYETAILGKWHLGEFKPDYIPTRRGFDHQHGHYFGALDYFTHIRDGVHDWYHDDRELKEEGYSTHLLAKEAKRLIKARDPKKPLFMYVPFNGVHAPLQVPDEYLKPYESLKGPRQKVAGMLSAVDEAIGQIVQSLDEAGMRDNTLIVFSSDNGGPNPGNTSTNGELRAGKGTLYEGGIRVCAFATWPGKIPAGTTVKEPMHMVDWYPTFSRLAGVKATGEQTLPLDGMDVWPMLSEGKKSPHEAILVAQGPGRYALRMGDWKLIAMTSPKQSATAAGPNANRRRAAKRATAANEEMSFELYNLALDLGEKTDLKDKEPARVKEMQDYLMKMVADAVPLPSGAEGSDE